MLIRQQSQLLEQQTLSQHACLSQNTRGRGRQEEECPIRTPFARDRDRIIHCNAYRRLMHKTQVFLSPEGDHYRTRLTHTQEVDQIARTLARALRLNEDLTEAISLGHDLGHTPFGHAGEFALQEICPHGFSHSAQSVRVVELLEHNGRGLNLTWEVRNGIGCHSSSAPSSLGKAQTLEGRIVYYADKIAYLNHDIQDAIRAKILSDDDIPWDIRYNLGRTKSERITTLITSLIENSIDDIKMDKNTEESFQSLRKFMFAEVYSNPIAKSEEGKAKDIVKSLYHYYVKAPDKLPNEYQYILERFDTHRAVCDYISGMSDRYAIAAFQNLFIPKGWAVTN